MASENHEIKTDPSSLLTQVSSLANANQQLEDQLKAQAVILGRFQEQEREEMKKKFDGMINQWINENDWTDQELKESVLKGMEEMVKKNKKESPIWNMVCCASETHVRNVTKLNQLQEEYNQLKGCVEGGTFRVDDARVGMKRKEPEGGSSSSSSGFERGGGGGGAGGGGGGGGSGSIWDDFESTVKGGSLSHFTPDPDTIKNLRQEWRPLS